MKVARFGQTCKSRVVARRLPPESSAVQVVSREVGGGAATLERWRAEALAIVAGERPGAGSHRWTAAAWLAAVIATAAMDEASRTRRRPRMSHRSRPGAEPGRAPGLARSEHRGTLGASR